MVIRIGKLAPVSGITIVATATSTAELVSYCRAFRPDVVIVGNSGKTELASAVTAGAFVHRIFAWLVPILVGLIPRRMAQEHGEGQGGREHVPGRYAV